MLAIIVANAIHISMITNKEPVVITETRVQIVEKPVDVVKEIIVEKKVEVSKPLNYTYDELYCMAVVIYNEAGSNSCTDEQRRMIGYVVLNRVNDTRFPDTIRGVLEQPGQYEGLGNSGINFAKRGNSSSEIKAIERAWTIAKQVLENRDNIPIPKNVIFQAEFKQGNGVYKKLSNTYFCYN
jgi:spore germination cell wall hydrolase CwlJ-like protein